MNAASNFIDKKLPTPDVDTTSGANPSNNPDLLADPSGEKMQALIWHGKNDVRMGEALKPKVVDDHDIVLRVTGSTVCGSGE